MESIKDLLCGDREWTIAPKEHLRPTGRCLRTCVRASHRKKVYSTYRCGIVTKSWNLVHACNKYQWWCSDLTIPGIDNNRDFQNSLFFYGDLIVLISEWHWFLFSDRSHLLHLFPNYLSWILAEMYVLEIPFALGENVCFTALYSLKKYDRGAQCGSEYYIMYCKFTRMRRYEFLIFDIFVVQDKKSPCMF